MRKMLHVCLLLSAAFLRPAAAEHPSAVTEIITFKTPGPGDSLKLHIYNPSGPSVPSRRPAIIFFFGGGWIGGTPSQFSMQAEHLASRGMVAICAEYRTKSSHNTSPFECVMDAKSAIRWIRKHADELDIDPDRIAAGGGSAGGHLAVAAATLKGFDEDQCRSTSCRPDALVLFNPVFDNGPGGYGYERVKERYKQFSPIHNIRKGLPPTLVMLGTDDQLIPVATAKKFKSLAEKVKSRCDLKLYEGQAHGFFNYARNRDMYYRTVQDMDLFLESLGYLTDRKTGNTISREAFITPPLEARPGAYWCWLNGYVDRKTLSREMEEAKALGMRGFEIWDIGVYRPVGMVPAGPAFLSERSLDNIRYAVQEAKRLGLELNMIAASSWNAGGAWVTREDGSKRLACSSIRVSGPQRFRGLLPLPCDSATFHRDVAVIAVPESPDSTVGSPQTVFDISGHLNAKSALTWDVSAGDWRVLRFVCIGTNQHLVVPSPNSDGLIIDHLSAAATERHMMHIIRKLEEADPGHSILKVLSHDSYEVNPAHDWTDDFVQEFRKRRRYDPRPYLPLLAGWKLRNGDIQRRFVADYRKTVGELITERHFAVSREVLHRHGMLLCAEAGHGGYARVDPLRALGQADIPRGEFWNGKRFWVTKEAASAANLYGRKFVEAESFTGWRNWLDGPLHYKQLFDVAVCAGLNRVVFHTFTHNPPEAGLPGFVYHAGEHFNANNTWWKQSGPMLTYMARCSYMMQQGNFVADVCFYYGDEAPNLVPSRRIDPNITPIYSPDRCLHCGRPMPIDFHQLGSGYDYDYIDAHSILNKMSVDPETGSLTVGSMRYRLLVLPARDYINPEVLRKIYDLVRQGGTILMPVQPVRSNSLTDYPRRDQEVERLGKELRGSEPADESGPASRIFGRGTVYTAGTAGQVLLHMGVQPDVTVLRGGSQEGSLRIDAIHRRTENADVYFVCNSAEEAKSLTCRFRSAEGSAEIWNPVTGDFRRARQVRRQSDGSCTLDLDLPAIGSAFVVFRRDGEPLAQESDLFADRAAGRIPITGDWTVAFQPGRRAPESVQFAELIDWTTADDAGINYFSGTATYAIQFDLSETLQGDFRLDLGRVCETGDVSFDGEELGTVWTFPYSVKVPAELLSKGSHRLEVKVTNVWHNRLAGDQLLPEEERVTSTNLKGRPARNSPLVPSGLLGPVMLYHYR